MDTWKTLKLFISSTFVDLELERDELTQQFRKLKAQLIERHLSFMTYDLRWRQKHQRDSIVKWCIEMVERCEFFVGILGSRYGWRPEKDAWGNNNDSNISVTEMEIRHALQNIDRQKRFFCILERDIDDAKDRASMLALKKDLKAQGEDVFEFSDTKTMLTFIVDKVQKQIDEHYPEVVINKDEENTREVLIENFIDEKLQGFVGREDFATKIWNFAHNRNQKNYLVVHAIAGTGKSAAMAQFYKRWKQEKDVPILRYFFSVDNSARQFVASIVDQLHHHGLLEETPKTDPLELRFQMRSTLENLSQKILIVIDAIDEVEEAHKDLSWLPNNLPQNINVIISTRPVSTFDIVRDYIKTQTIELPPLSTKEIALIIDSYTKKHQIDISTEDAQLLQTRADGNPLYLKVALEEIVSSGSGVGQLATSIDALFEQIIQRLSDKYDTNVIFDYLGLITASESGLMETELQEVLQQYYNIGDDLLLIVAKALDNFIVERGQLLQFFHAEFERSVKERLGRNRLRNYHQKLADYFKAKGYKYPRALKEICYQMLWAEKYKSLLQQLCDFHFLQQKSKMGMIDELVQDFEMALYHPLLPMPQNTQDTYNDVEINRETLRLLCHALTLDLRFLRRHPECIFQCLWNRCYWYDNPKVKNYYNYDDNSQLPWNNTKLFLLVEKWRESFHGTWAKSLSPAEPHLDSKLRRLFMGHSREVYSVAFHQDRQRIVSVSEDKKVRLWNAETGESLHEITEHGEVVRATTFSNDGKKFATASDDGFIFIWDTQTAECLQIIESGLGTITALQFTHQNKQLLSGGDDARIVIWDVESGQRAYFLEGHRDAIYALHAMDDYTASAAKDGEIKIWQNEECIATFTGHDRIVNDVKFSFDGKYLASCSKDNTIRIWEIATKKCLRVIENHYDSINAIDFIPHTHLLVSGSDDRSLCVTDITTSNVVLGWKHHNWQVTSLQVSLDGNYVVCGARDGSVSLWDIRRHAAQSNMQLSIKGHKERIRRLCILRKQNQAVTGAKDQFIKIWDVKSGECNKSIFTDMKIRCLNISEDETKVVVGSRQGDIGIWNLQTGDFIHRMKGHKGIVSSIMFCHNDKHILSIGYYDNTMRLWSVADGSCLNIYEGHKRWIESVDVDRNARLIATGSRDKTLKIWDMQGNCLRTMHGHELGVMSVAFNSDSSKIASASARQGIVRIWNVQTGACLHVLSGHKDMITHMRFKGEQLISTSRDHQTFVWNTNDGSLIRTIDGQTDLESYCNESIFSIAQSWKTSIVKDDKDLVYLPEKMSFVSVIDDHIVGIYKSNERSISVLKIVEN
ncbi:DUF4062 domain-containing protein [Candidatus Uabimicrobium amorphum]|uniref:DUF4062 domain-containing protein n=1 Tax=Uabimicrobium amorphum TaxID=2596890 RepID=A0A5S9IIM1_UABAM|nr:DUF4062 domain-containing protein [Candidatus Uabimicrobium amorphum]BBM81740.1 hypothetical protein UABAM_00079 [Candidatus Uabimicrobium amorphum]